MLVNEKVSNVNNIKEWSDLDNPMEDKNHRFVLKNQDDQGKGALRRMKM